ncbi:DUF368 domain-containing protein [Lentibacillus sp. N15]|uniref:DUF368 domain-containing protein n=1 Tax=Lentibacillus songyuanensis TaxID=3136161 RepID=UPI0031BA4896
MEWKNIYRGILMGASDVIPGVSGGTIAVLLGIYDRLIAAINGIFGRGWKRQLSFLIPLAIGVGIAILALSRLITWLLDNYVVPTQFFFLGLIIGILPYLFHQADAKRTFRVNHYLLLLIGAILIGSLVFLHKGSPAEIAEMTTSTYVLLFFSGFLASSAMILPGISGSFMLLVIGVYPTIMHAVSHLRLDILAVTGIGIVAGIIIMSKVIHFFLERFKLATFALIIGSVIGSIIVVFPGWPITLPLVLLSIATFAIGLLVAYILGRVEYTS